MFSTSNRGAMGGPSMTGDDARSSQGPLVLSELQSLRDHKLWADKKIDQLIKRVRDSEGPQRLLTEEVQQLRLVSHPHRVVCMFPGHSFVAALAPRKYASVEQPSSNTACVPT